MRAAAPRARDFTDQRYQWGRCIDVAIKAKNRTKSWVRAEVQHAFGVIKRVFEFDKVRYHGLAKNPHRLEVSAALANLFVVRQRLLNEEETWLCRMAVRSIRGEQRHSSNPKARIRLRPSHLRVRAHFSDPFFRPSLNGRSWIGSILVRPPDRLIEVNHRTGHEPRLVAGQEGHGARYFVDRDQSPKWLLFGSAREPVWASSVVFALHAIFTIGCHPADVETVDTDAVSEQRECGILRQCR